MDDQIGEFNAATVGDLQIFSDERRRERNVRLDWDGVDMENARTLKQRRASAKGVLTKAITHVSGALVVGGDVMEVQTMQERLIRVFSSFKEACDRYKDTLVDDIDVEESVAYLHEAESRYLAAKDRIALWLQSNRNSSVEERDKSDVDANDSVSQTNSRSSRRSSSSRHSKLSIEAQQFKNAAKLASLRAEASLFKQRQSIANEELRISQMKQKLELETQMAKLEAEERVCADFRTSVNETSNGKPFETVQKTNVFSTPLHDTQTTDQVQKGMLRSVKSVTLSEPAHEPVTCQPAFKSRVVTTTPEEPVKTGESQFAAPDDVDPAPLQNAHASPDPWNSSVVNGAPPSQFENTHHAMQSTTLSPLAPPWQPNMQKIAEKPKHEDVSSNAEDSGVMYLEAMRKLATATLLPRSELMVFDGNPIQYSLFIRSFENNVEIGTSDFSKRLQLLIQFCSGKARKAIENCILLEPKEGYLKAKQLLSDRFGGAYKVSNKWLAKVSEGSQIRPGDGEALQELADDLESCEITLKATGRMSQLNNEDRLVKIVQRCPAYVKSRWQARVQEIRMRERDPNIEDLRKLIRLAAREKTDPVFGGIMDAGNKDPSGKQRTSRRLESAKGRVFSINTTEQQSSEKVSTNLKCYFCNQNHRLENCNEFLQQNGEQQFKFIRSKKLCDNCLSSFHFSAGCKRRKACTVPGCNMTRKHIGAIHDSVKAFELRRSEQRNIGVGSAGRDAGQSARSNQTKSYEAKEATSKSRASGAVSQFNGLADDTGAGSVGKGLPIVPVKVTCHSTKKVFTTYALLDSGSTASFCSNTLLEELEVNSKKCHIQLGTINGVQDDCQTTVTNLEVMDLDETVCIKIDNVFSVKCLNVSREAIARQEDVDNWSHLRDIQLPKAITNGQVNLLIGVDVPKALQPCEIRRCEGGGPFAVRTVFGWTLNGPLGRSGVNGESCFSSNSKSVDDELQKQLIKYFNQEFNEPLNAERKSMSVNDKKAMKIMEDSLTFVNGHYQMAIPWKDETPSLPNNRSMAESRLAHLKRKLSRDSTMRIKYTGFIDDLLIKGYARKIPEKPNKDVSSISWYLPHHNVVNPKKPDKVRVVFDCAAKFNDESLNSNVLQGPDLTNSLVGVLCRFRQENVAIVADVEAMYHQVRVNPNDTDALKFMWFPGGDLSKQPEEYQMLVHLFGGIWSSCCANYALRRTALDNSDKFDADIVSTVQRDFYVDDLIKSVKTSEDAIRMQQQLTRMLACGGFHLTKWNSNCRKVLDAISLGERSKELSNINIENDALPVERTLGLEWDIEKDSFRFKINVKEKPATRRGMLSIISSIFDPLGFVAPFILPAKVLLQMSCHQLGWDDEISGENLARWKSWLTDLPTLESFLTKRCVKPHDFGEIVHTEIHHFSDASETGYGTVSYLRSINEDGKINCAFLFAKSRLAPMKRITIPRLELTAATLAVKIDGMLRRELEISIDKSVFWTDSTCVLRYIKNKERRFHTFVANRISVIHDGSDPNQWHYVATRENPADDASRGLSANDFLISKRWIHGPEFLWKDADAWPTCDENISVVAEDDVEVKRLVHTHSVEVSNNGISSRIFSRFSNWFKLKKAVAWLLRFKKWLMHKIRKEDEKSQLKFQKRITVEEMNEAEDVIVKCVQSECFAEEIDTMQCNGMVKKSSSLRRLDPFLKEGVICVGGRLKNAPYEYNDAKHPLILPKNHHVSNLIILHFHETSGHFGQEYVLSLLRERFWIIQARVPVRRITKQCFDCKRRTQEPSHQKMADLPADRITPNNPPFTSVGVDYFGPFLVKRGRAMVKRYGVVFTCLAVRAVHIEIAHSLDTDSFINALRRFMARRGTPEMMRSDNGTNFKGGERELREAMEQWNQDKLHEFCLQRKVRWIFNPPAASHMGGAWERMIRSIRRILNALLKNQTLDDESLSTLMCEVESILNARPLTKVSDDSRDLNALTPNHLLLLKSDAVLPPGIFDRSDQYCNKRWRQIQYMANVFWKRWTREYLPILQVRQKWQTVRRNLAKDDIVLVADKSSPRNRWPLGRILEVYPGRDGLIRSARLKTGNGELVRPIETLCILEGQDV